MKSLVPLGEGLRAELGAPGSSRRLESSPRSRVWQVELGGRPVVVKQLVEGPGADERYAREVAGLRLAAPGPGHPWCPSCSPPTPSSACWSWSSWST